MGNSGSSTPPAPVPATPMPIEDSIASKREAAAISAKRAGEASLNANDLNQETANKEPAITRSQLGSVEQFGAQPQPRGPRADKSPRGPQIAASTQASGIGAPAIITG